MQISAGEDSSAPQLRRGRDGRGAEAPPTATGGGDCSPDDRWWAGRAAGAGPAGRGRPESPGKEALGERGCTGRSRRRRQVSSGGREVRPEIGTGEALGLPVPRPAPASSRGGTAILNRKIGSQLARRGCRPAFCLRGVRPARSWGALVPDRTVSAEAGPGWGGLGGAPRRSVTVLSAPGPRTRSPCRSGPPSAAQPCRYFSTIFKSNVKKPIARFIPL